MSFVKMPRHCRCIVCKTKEKMTHKGMFGVNNNRKKKKREARRKSPAADRKLVVLNEEELIRQVYLRPAIYDRSLKGNRKNSLRNQYWQEISLAMNVTENECRTRWRSLRDAFTKHYKATQKNGGNKQSKWLFYDKMTFLAPHLDSVYSELLDELCDNSEDAQSVSCEPVVINEALLDDIDKTLPSTSILEEFSEPEKILPQGFKLNPSAEQLVTHHINPLMDIQRCEKATNLFDSDEKFLLSCVPALKRLTYKQNALARLKIQQILFDIEFQQQTN